MADGDGDILNDDCLLLIFKYFDIFELLELETVSEQFKRCAEQKYRTYNRISIELRYIEKEINKMNDLFKRIGNYLKTVEYSGGFLVDLYNAKVLEPMTDHCTHLTELKLLYIRFSPYVDDILRRIVPKLVTITIGNCVTTPEFEGTLIKYGQNLRNIYVFGGTDISITTLLTFTALERVESIFKHVDDMELYRQFILKNKLKYLKLSVFKSVPIDNQIELKEMIKYLQPNIDLIIVPLPYDL